MKFLQAYIQPHKLWDVTTALLPHCSFTAIDVRGRGHGKQAAERERASETIRTFEDHVKIELCCADLAVEQIVAAIQSAAHTGLAGDGLIVVTPVELAVRIRTGDRSEDAC